MSYWTHIIGTIKVSTLGRSTEEHEYILKTVLKHLPVVSGSESDMYYDIIPNRYANISSNCDEFDNTTEEIRRNEYNFDINDDFFILVYGNFRDRKFDETYKEFQNWLCRLAKRVVVYDVVVNINDGYNKNVVITNKNDCYTDMFEYPSWSKINKEKEPNWCEYLMWKKAIGGSLPMLLEYKYYENADNDYFVENFHFMGIKND